MSRPTGANRQQDKLDALHAQLAEQVKALRTSDDWVAWLKVADRFHSYSFRNTLLILAQRPDATRVAGYSAWQQLNRQVSKGEKGIQILAPVLRRSRPANPDNSSAAETTSRPGQDDQRETRLVGVRLTYVWDISQTHGDPLPEPPRTPLLAGQAPEGLWDSLAQLAEQQGFTLSRGSCDGANGVTDFLDRTIQVRDDVEDAQAVKTLIHELGHVLLHDPAGDIAAIELCRGKREVEAESVAYLVAAHHGLATDDYTFPYVAAWATTEADTDPEDVVWATGQRVMTAARTILAATQQVDVDATQVERLAATAESVAARADAGVSRTALVARAAEVAASDATFKLDPTGPDAIKAACAEALRFFVDQVREGWVPDYLRDRGLADALSVSSPWGVGYAPNSWHALVQQLHWVGVPPETVTAAGLAMPARRGDGIIDRLHDRLTLPIHDADGDVVGFVGRCRPGAEDATAKYLNTPTTLAYRKSECLLGLEQNRRLLTSGAVPVLVEGPLDAIAVTSAGQGLYAGIASCGTALTERQVELLAEVARGRIIVALDDDEAGLKASTRALGMLQRLGQVDAARLPSQTDPAECLRVAGPDALLLALNASHPLAEHLINRRLAQTGELRWVEERVRVAAWLTPLIHAVAADRRGAVVADVGRRLGLVEESIRAVVYQRPRTHDLPRPRAGPSATRSPLRR